MFGFFDENEKVLSMQQRIQYTSDSFGLKTLDKEGKIIMTVRSGFNHSQWSRDQQVFDEYVIPHLD
jgi:Palmitoyl protein thioesterase.